MGDAGCIKGGMLSKQRRKKNMVMNPWRKRNFELYPGYCLIKYDDGRVKERLDLVACSIDHFGASHQCILQLDGPDAAQKLQVRADSERDAEEWLESFRQAISGGDEGMAALRTTRDSVEDRSALEARSEVMTGFKAALHAAGATLLVTVHQGMDLLDTKGKPFCGFVVVRHGGQEERTGIRTAISTGSDAKWGSTLSFSFSPVDKTVSLSLFPQAHFGSGGGLFRSMSGSDKRPHVLARTQFNLLNLVLNTEMTIWLPLVQPSSSELDSAPAGGIQVTLVVQNSAEGLAGGEGQIHHMTIAQLVSNSSLLFGRRISQLTAEVKKLEDNCRILREGYFSMLSEVGSLVPRIGVTLTFVEAANLPAADSNGLSDPYVRFFLRQSLDKTVYDRKSGFVTNHVKKTLNPVWNKSFTVNVLRGSEVYVEVWDWDFGTSDDLLGTVIIPVETFMESGDKWFALHAEQQGYEGRGGSIHIQWRCDGNGERCSWGSEVTASSEELVMAGLDRSKEVQKQLSVLSLRMDEQEQEKSKLVQDVHHMVINDHRAHCSGIVGTLQARVVSLSVPSLNGKRVFAAWIMPSGREVRLPMLEKNRGAKTGWEDAVALTVQDSDGNADLELEVWTVHRKFGSDALEYEKLQGKASFSIFEHLYEQARTKIIDVKSDGESCGSVTLELQYLRAETTDMAATRTTDSTNSLYHQLFYYFMGDMAFATNVLAAVDSAEMDSMCSLLVRILDRSDMALELCRVLIQAEVSSTLSEGTLFRRNSAASKCMGRYAMDKGKHYLRATLGGILGAVLSDDASFEVDPHRVEPGELVSSNAGTLLRHCHRVFEAITSSFKEMPSAIFELAIVLRQYVEERFPDSVHRALGGFLFLRFFVPAITTPEAFGVLDEPPSPSGRRLLVLISKVLQNVSNCVRFGAKESHMSILNEFIDQSDPELRSYFDLFREQPDSDSLSQRIRSVSIHSMSGESRGNDVLSREILTDLKALHAVICRYEDKVVPVSDDRGSLMFKMKEILKELGPPDNDALRDLIKRMAGEIDRETVMTHLQEVLTFYRDFYHSATHRLKSVQR